MSNFSFISVANFILGSKIAFLHHLNLKAIPIPQFPSSQIPIIDPLQTRDLTSGNEDLKSPRRIYTNLVTKMVASVIVHFCVCICTCLRDIYSGFYP